MPNKPSDALTQTDMSNLITIMQCLDEMPKVNIPKFMKAGKYTKSSASTIWGRIKAKLVYMAEHNVTISAADIPALKGGRVKGAIGKAADENNDDEDARGPVKKRKRNTKADDSDDFEPAVKKGRGRKGKTIKEEIVEEDADEVEQAATADEEDDLGLTIKQVRGRLSMVDDELDEVEAQMDAEIDAADGNGGKMEAEDDMADQDGIKMEMGDDEA